MFQVVNLLDLIAGLLVALNFLIPDKTLEKYDKWILNGLPESGEEWDPLQPKSLRLSIPLATIVFVGLIVWAMLRDLANNTYSADQVAISALLYVFGALTGGVMLLILAFLLRRFMTLAWAKKIFNIKQKVDIRPAIWIFSMVLCLLPVLVLGPIGATGAIIAIGATFSIGSFLLGMWMLLVPFVCKYLTLRRDRVLARIGLIVFIASKLIQIILT